MPTRILNVDFKERRLISAVDVEVQRPESEPPNEKRKTFEKFIATATVTTVFNSCLPGVVLPAEFVGKLQMQLNWSLKFNIPDLKVDESGIRGTLSFGGNPFQVFVPWHALYMVTCQGHTKVWQEDIPNMQV